LKPKKKKRRKNKGAIWLAAGTICILAFLTWIFVGGSSKQFTETGAKLVATMSPSYFSSDPRAQAAYQAAKDIPEVLAELPCFCGCMTQYGHENNLFCFKDQHGSGCEVCEDIALDARDMHAKGLSPAQIKENIIQRYARRGN